MQDILGSDAAVSQPSALDADADADDEGSWPLCRGLILQSPGNMRRERILAHLRAQGVEIASVLDLDSMLGTLEYAEASDYLTVLPGIMVFPEIEQATLCVRPIRDKGFILDMMAIEPKETPGARQSMR